MTTTLNRPSRWEIVRNSKERERKREDKKKDLETTENKKEILYIPDSKTTSIMFPELLPRR